MEDKDDHRGDSIKTNSLEFILLENLKNRDRCRDLGCNDYSINRSTENVSNQIVISNESFMSYISTNTKHLLLDASEVQMFGSWIIIK